LLSNQQEKTLLEWTAR